MSQYYMHDAMKCFVPYKKSRNQGGNVSESRKSKVEPEIGYAEEPQWLRSYVNDPEGNSGSSEHTTDDTD
jgi:hypothetical protein